MAIPTVAPSRPRSLGLRIAISSLRIVALVYLGLCLLFYFAQDSLVFPAPKHYEVNTPTEANIGFADLHIPVDHAGQMHAWYIPAATSSDKVLLYFHGNGYCIEQTAVPSIGEVIPLHNTGANVLMADYRGYGTSSPGTANENRVYEDGRAALNYLTQVRKVPMHNIIIVGRSIGTGVATELAKESPGVGGLILVSPFTNTAAIADSVWYLRMPPLAILGHNKFDNLSKIGDVLVPLFIAVGDHDTLTPSSMAQALMEKANEPKHLYIVPGPDHNGMFQVGQQELVGQISNFTQGLQ
jgi:prepilin-type processing-associated H-X9-DG protein